MKEVRRFENNQLFAIKAYDNFVRTGVKVAVLGRFEPNGCVRPGFKVNVISSEGVAGAAQAIRFDDVRDADRWISEFDSYYGYRSNVDMTVMNSRAGEFVKLPLADFNTDVWVNSVILNKFTPNQRANLIRYAPQYLSENPDTTAPNQYRGFRF